MSDGWPTAVAAVAAVLGVVGVVYVVKSSSGGGGGGGKPALTVSPTTIAQGSTLSWAVTGFTPNASLTALSITDSASAVLYLSPLPTLDDNGAASAGVFIGPNVSAGAATLTAIDSTGVTASAAFTVTGSSTSSTPALAVSPNPVAQGADLTIVMSGFTPNTQIASLDLTDSANAVLSLSPLPTTNSSGGATSVVLIGTNVSIGAASVKVTDAVGLTADADFTVT